MGGVEMGLGISVLVSFRIINKVHQSNNQAVLLTGITDVFSWALNHFWGLWDNPEERGLFSALCLPSFLRKASFTEEALLRCSWQVFLWFVSPAVQVEAFPQA